MKQNEVTPGMLVSVNSKPDGMVYTVEEVDGNDCVLSYPSSRGKLTCPADISILRSPTPKQLVAYALVKA